MLAAVLVFVGGGLGAVARHGVNLAAARWIGIDFPWGTFIVNVTGAIVMGALAAWFAFRANIAWSEELRLFTTTGILGGFTTFSAFSLDAALLWERHDYGPLALYVTASVGLSIVGLFIGLWIVRSLT